MFIHQVITIDGPAASGKSVAGQVLAEKLGYLFVSSGHFYRALAWAADRYKIDLSKSEVIARWLEQLSFQHKIIDSELHLFIDGQDVTSHLNDEVVNKLVSPLAAIPVVRNFLFTRFRSLADQYDLVMEGRDIGSVVFPEAKYKFYLDASPEVRARRRANQGIIDSVTQRDQQDSTRTTAPLVIPEGATVIDTSNLTIFQTHQAIEQMMEKIKILS
ncbi:MAG: (d)CMP kinase [Verrucomicrobia bacterium]|nr:(d)CMP kinase [Verrucomicrobiota bacterium]